MVRTITHPNHTYLQQHKNIYKVTGTGPYPKFYNLSGGERRFLECLLMIYSDTEYALLDEPFSQLSPLWVEELKNHINDAKACKGFIITDHYYKSILDVSDRIVLLHNRCNYTIQNEADLILHGYLPGRIT